MILRTKALLFNSILIAVSTSLITTILHEMAHFMMAKYLGVEAVLHHNYVMTPENTPLQTGTIIAAAGPLFSLIFGIFVLTFSINSIKPSLLKLFTLWLGMWNIVTFLGYLLIAPIASEGDTGKVFNYLGFPIYVSIAIAVAAFVVVNIVFSKLADQFKFYTSITGNKNEDCRQLLIYPIYASIIFGTLLNLPVITWVSLLPTIFMPLTFFSTMGGYKGLAIINEQLIVKKVSILLVVLTLGCIVLFRYLV